MVEFEEYPHTIISQSSTSTEPVQDPNTGNWIVPTTTPTDIITEGRAKPNDKGKTVAGEDGASLDFSFLIYMPQEAPVFPVGSLVTIDGFGSGIVKRFFRGQLNCTMWV